MVDLSDSERRLAGLLVDGHSLESVAEQLGIAPRTVDLHRRQLGRKLGAKSLRQLGYEFAVHEQAFGSREPMESLTSRSLAMAQLLIAGLSNKGIAAALSISLRQVEYRLEDLREKTQSETAAQLGYRLAEHGIEANAEAPAPPPGRETFW